MVYYRNIRICTSFMNIYLYGIDQIVTNAFTFYVVLHTGTTVPKARPSIHIGNFRIDFLI